MKRNIKCLRNRDRNVKKQFEQGVRGEEIETKTQPEHQKFLNTSLKRAGHTSWTLNNYSLVIMGQVVTISEKNAQSVSPHSTRLNPTNRSLFPIGPSHPLVCFTCIFHCSSLACV